MITPAGDEQTARALLRQHAISPDTARLRPLPHVGWGGDNDAWLVDGRWIFRFPRTTEAAAALEREVRFLPTLASRSPLAVPRFGHVARDDHGRPLFAGYEAIPGRPLRGDDARAASAEQAGRMAEQLGRFLTALHTLPPDEALACGIAPPPDDVHAHAARTFEAIRATVFPALAADERRWVSRLFEALLGDDRYLRYTPSACHGDLSSDHILHDPATMLLTGIIDFGDLCIGDPAGEFTWRAEYGEPFFQDVLAAYQAPHGDCLPDRVTMHMDRVPLIEIGYGVETGRADYVEEGRRFLRERMNRSPRR